MNIEEKLDKEISTIVVGSEKKKRPAKGKITFTKFLSNRMMIIAVIREGVPYSLFSLIREVTPFGDADWAKFLDISTKSLQRYKQSSKQFKCSHSEKIIEIAEVAVLGREVFGSPEKFKLWLETPNFALGSLTPFELLSDSYGKELVIAELTNIEHGILV